MGDLRKLTPGGNWLWEGSRMMLPEHKLGLNGHQNELLQRRQVELSGDEWEQISFLFQQSMQHLIAIQIKLFDENEDLYVVGIVSRLDPLGRRFMVDGEWFAFSKIEGASLLSY
ncbi:YolD-like family protein [Paenibacillus oenotherae]|uniref:YolD-like family protein n=1 Tax=Paenibacillus oenotherae TaxID=1435645 RepID=A0ABS7DB08_9BACL|nr:YolD-like family protein [Paenibacillus oenotherae]MBW7477070.1 YolD-like family protein [Paenibacillus oenotherae]